MNDQTLLPQLEIDPNCIQKQYLRDLFRFRELFYFFCWRDLLVRYKQAVFGIAWAIIRPVLHMFVFTLLFNRIAKLPSSDVNYSLFVLAGMLPWQLFSNAILDGSNSIVVNAHLITKIYFPRMMIPAAQIVVHLTDFCVGALILLAGCLIGGYLTLSAVVLYPLFVLLTLLLSLGGSLWLSALTVQYRDFRFIVPFVVQFGMFISPVGYGTFMIPEHYRWVYYLNPMVGIIDSFRWILFGISYPGMEWSILSSLFISLALLVTGFYYFRKMETSFADRI